ncbi:tachylectin-related carbohydrate-binding protein [Actinoplanes sp. NPDC051861]|uniref:tachylectin-related carbohydrate-binding protein n=1 Tax=Actinoplanes sp. NPDC051861 TaxID=3155170 RepID=UPI003434469E
MTTNLRRLAGSTVVVLAAAPLALVGGSPAVAADTFTCSGGATLFGAETNGNLRRYSYASPGTTNATGGTHGVVGTGWNGFGRILGGPDGKVYGINSTGMYRYRWNGTNWDSINGAQSEKLSDAFNEYASAAGRNKITVDSLGDFYTVDSGGKLRWSRYNEQSKTWTVLNRVLDTGWDRYDLIVAAGPGVLYGRALNGHLYRHRFEATSQRWVNQNQLVGDGWQMFTKGMFSVGGETLFGIQGNGDLNHYRWQLDTQTWPVGGTRFGVGWQSFANVFAVTDTCRVAEQQIPPRPGTTVEPFTPTAVVQAPASGTALGAIEYVYTDNLGRLRHGHQASPGNFHLVQWSTVNSDEAFTGKPTLIRNGQGSLQVLTQSIASDVWSFTRAAAPDTGWQAGLNLSGILGSRPVAARLSDNTAAVFATDDSGSLWFRSQDGPAGDLLPWRPLGGSNLRQLVVVAGADRSATLFASDPAGLPIYATYRDATLSSWAPLGGITPTGPLAVITLPGRILRLFARTADGQILTQIQQSAGGGFNAVWKPVGTFAAAGPPAAVLDPELGRIAVVARGPDNAIYRVFETAQATGAWGGWERIDTQGDPAATEPTVAEFTGTDGQQSWLIVYRNQNDSTKVYTRQAPPDAAARGTAEAVPGFTRHTLAAPR